MEGALVHDAPKSLLKRTISKCSMDAGDASVALKKLSPPRHQHLQPEEGSPDYFDRVLEANNGELELHAGVGYAQLTAARLFAALVDYLQDVAAYYDRAMGFSFEQLKQLLHSAPFATRQLQGLVQARLGLAWPLVNALVEHVLAFVCDEDLKDAVVGEFAAFAQHCAGPNNSAVAMTGGDVFAQLGDFFRDVLDAFKRFLTKRWIQAGRINFPCEFGKKSDTLFLCMECHREHR